MGREESKKDETKTNVRRGGGQNLKTSSNHDDKKKKIIAITIFSVLLIVFLVVGITYAIRIFEDESDINTIKTGKISMSYTESSNVINLTNALPMADNDGKLQTDYFDFSITSNADTNADDNEGITIPYKLIIQERNIDNDKIQLRDNQIKVYLTKIESGIEIPVIGPTLISNLDKKDTNYNLYITNNTHKNNIGKITTNYRLRAWIDMNVDANLFNENNYQYKFSINVNSNDKNIVTYKLGDVNGDGEIDIADLQSIYEYMSNTTTLDHTYVLHSGDLNGDGKVDESDKDLLYEYISGQITTFPAGEPMEERSYEISDKITITYKLGDVNGDGKINATDAVQISMFANNKSKLDPIYVLHVGDVNGDGKADVNDSELITKYSSGYITTFPAGEPLEERSYEISDKITITYKLGDVNNDGKILANDGALILRHASNQTEYDPRYVEYSGDVNGDGTADESDSTLINEYVNSKITTFPAGTPLEERTYEAQVK